MVIYVNSKTAYTLYKSETVKPYFIDKTMILEELFPFFKRSGCGRYIRGFTDLSGNRLS